MSDGLQMTPGELEVWRAAYATAYVQLQHEWRGHAIDWCSWGQQAADIAFCAVLGLRSLVDNSDFGADARQAIGVPPGPAPKSEPPHPTDCRCGGAGWVWGHELRTPENPTTDQKYQCPYQEDP